MRAATGVPSVGHVVVGRRERAVGTANRAAGQPQPVERLRAGDLVHEVQVDVEQARGDLVGVPDLVEERRGIMSRRSPADTTASRTASSSSGVLEVVGKVGVEGHAVARRPASWRCAVEDSTTRAGLDQRGLAAAGLVHRRVAGAAGASRPGRGCAGRARRAGRAAAG